MWDRGLVVRAKEKRTGDEWAYTEHMEEEWISQSAHSGRRRIRNRSQEHMAAVGYGSVQLCFHHAREPKYGEYGRVPAR